MQRFLVKWVLDIPTAFRAAARDSPASKIDLYSVCIPGREKVLLRVLDRTGPGVASVERKYRILSNRIRTSIIGRGRLVGGDPDGGKVGV